jgi:hypothetical protein
MRRGHVAAATLSVFLTQMQWAADEVDPATIPADLQSAQLDSGERDTLALALSLGD